MFFKNKKSNKQNEEMEMKRSEVLEVLQNQGCMRVIFISYIWSEFAKMKLALCEQDAEKLLEKYLDLSDNVIFQDFIEKEIENMKSPQN